MYKMKNKNQSSQGENNSKKKQSIKQRFMGLLPEELEELGLDLTLSVKAMRMSQLVVVED